MTVVREWTLNRKFLGFIDCMRVDLIRGKDAKEENLVMMTKSDINDGIEFFRLSYTSSMDKLEVVALNETLLPREVLSQPNQERRQISKIESKCFIDKDVGKNRVQ